jgi:TPP-dependent pyruvate/acetoin dehydrogenase alpha subunit
LADRKCPPPPQFHIDGDGTDGIADGALKHLLVTMLRIREFEERIATLVEQKRIVTPCHLYVGQEAVAAGVCHTLKTDDYIFGTHRSHGHYLAKGGDLKAAMAEIFGRATGCSGGRGGSMHLVAPELGIMGTSSIVAGSLPLAVGAALAESIRGSGRVAVVFHGDAVPEEGVWHESANLAALKRLPIVFVCENNLYCTHMSLDKRRVHDNIPEIAAGHGLRVAVVDGNNVLETFYAARSAVARARAGQGPGFIECRTYRWRGHVGPNYDVDLGLRSQAELEAWMERCPIKHFEDFLLASKVLSPDEAARLRKEALAEVDDAVEYALASPYPEVPTLTGYVYAGTVEGERGDG